MYSEYYEEIFDELLPQTVNHTLDLGKFCIENDGVKILVRKLNAHLSIHHLYCFDNEITAEGSQSLIEIIQQNKLQTLQLFSNPLGSAGLEYIAHKLIQARNTTLRILGVGDALIKSEGTLSQSCANAFAELLATNQTLVELNLANNNLGDSQVKILANGLVNNGSLQKLHIGNMDDVYRQRSLLTTSGVDYLLRRLKRNYSLVYLVTGLEQRENEPAMSKKDLENPESFAAEKAWSREVNQACQAYLTRNRKIANVLMSVRACLSVETLMANCQNHALLITLTTCIPELNNDQFFAYNPYQLEIAETYELLSGLDLLFKNQRNEAEDRLSIAFTTHPNLQILAHEALGKLLSDSSIDPLSLSMETLRLEKTVSPSPQSPGEQVRLSENRHRFKLNATNDKNMVHSDLPSPRR